MYEIEIDVPYIETHAQKKGNRKYPFHDMDVGDSFALEDSEREKVRTACFNHGTRNNVLFKVARDLNGVFRCWRLE